MIKDSFGIRKSDIINRRMFIIGAAKLIIFGGIIARLFSLQINDNKKYLTLSDKNRIREWKLPPTRGNIVDYFGNIIAGNLRVYQLHVIPEQVENFNYLISRLKTILQLSNKRVERIKIIRKQQLGDFTPLYPSPLRPKGGFSGAPNIKGPTATLTQLEQEKEEHEVLAARAAAEEEERQRRMLREVEEKEMKEKGFWWKQVGPDDEYSNTIEKPCFDTCPKSGMLDYILSLIHI